MIASSSATSDIFGRYRSNTGRRTRSSTRSSERRANNRGFVGTGHADVTDYYYVDCEEYREALSARLDDEEGPEDAGSRSTSIWSSAPTARCWYDDAALITRRTRTTAAVAWPDVTDAVLARAPSGAGRRPGRLRAAVGAVGALLRASRPARPGHRPGPTTTPAAWQLALGVAFRRRRGPPRAGPAGWSRCSPRSSPCCRGGTSATCSPAGRAPVASCRTRWRRRPRARRAARQNAADAARTDPTGNQLRPSGPIVESDRRLRRWRARRNSANRLDKGGVSAATPLPRSMIIRSCRKAGRIPV